MSKGHVLEEALRAYFLRAGFFVVRGVPFRFGDDDLTDIDLWLYERPTGTTRRVQICDIKYKQRPKAVERIFWTAGIAAALDVDGAFVATTDKRPSLRPVAKKLGLQLIDGTDLQRVQASHNVSYPDRIVDEEFVQQLQRVDKNFRSKEMQEARFDVLLSLSEGFGASSVVRSLDGFGRLATKVVTYHPDSESARAAGRLAYLAAAIACQSLDFVSVEAAFRSIEERRDLVLNAVRYGALGGDQASQMLQLAVGLVEKYSAGGKAAARSMEMALKKDLDALPAEIIADQAIKLLRNDNLFVAGRDLEMAAYSRELPPFDHLSTIAKSMVGALLDYAGVDRRKFAEGWAAPNANRLAADKETALGSITDPPRTLFDRESDLGSK